jgi:hypothetical protein
MEKGGRVYVCNWNTSTQQYVKQTTAVLNISEEVGNWRDHGMLALRLIPILIYNGFDICDVCGRPALSH